MAPRYLVGGFTQIQMSLLGPLSPSLLRSPNTPSHQASQLWAGAKRRIKDPTVVLSL